MSALQMLVTLIMIGAPCEKILEYQVVVPFDDVSAWVHAQKWTKEQRHDFWARYDNVESHCK